MEKYFAIKKPPNVSNPHKLASKSCGMQNDILLDLTKCSRLGE
jgi:hypothetical protein